MRKAKGFTLIELLVVIAIMGLLMAILVPSLQRVRNEGKAIVCRSNLRQWGLAYEMYTNDNEGRFPNKLLKDPMVGTFIDWYPLTKGYRSHTEAIRFCPQAKTPSTLHPGLGDKFHAWWFRTSPREFSASYGTNGWCPDLGNSYSALISERWKHANHRGASNIPVLLDCALPGGLPRAPPLDPRPCEDRLDGSYTMSQFNMNRHDGHVNSLFMDWSARKVGLKKLWTLKWHRNFNTSNRWTRAGGVRPEDWPEWMRGFKDY